eukprot:271671-Amphidinium_carterae.1
MKGGVSGASNEVVSSTANGRLAWVQASRILRGLGQGDVLPWQNRGWMRDIFNHASSSSLPTFDRNLLNESISDDAHTTEAASLALLKVALPASHRAFGVPPIRRYRLRHLIGYMLFLIHSRARFSDAPLHVRREPSLDLSSDGYGFVETETVVAKNIHSGVFKHRGMTLLGMSSTQAAQTKPESPWRLGQCWEVM